MNSKKKALALFAKTRAHKTKVENSLQIIQKAFSTTGSWYTAFSGGKDSTVLFSLVRKIKPDMIGIWGDDEFFLPETFEYISRMKETGANILQVKHEGKHVEWFTANAGLDSSSVYKHYAGAFIGLRAQENNSRRIWLKKFGLLYNSEKKGWLCNPLAWWTTIDIWAYIYSREIDYNKAYDVLEGIGVDIEHQRVGPYATEKALGYGQLAILKKGWPKEYQRFCNKFPQAGAFV